MMNVAEAVPSRSSFEDVSALLRLSSQDDGFREELQRNPAESLKSLGLTLAPECLPAEIRLPEKAEIQNLLPTLEMADALAQQREWTGLIVGD